jgi:hypothetical protein
VNLLGEQSITTIDGAVFPVNTEDIVFEAVTDLVAVNGQSVIGALANSPNWTLVMGTNAIPEGGQIAIAASVFLQKVGGPIVNAAARLLRNGQFSAVYFFDKSAGTFTDETTDAFSTSVSDVTMCGEGGAQDNADYLYLGSRVLFGHSLNSSGPRPYFEITSLAGSGTVVVEYWNGSAWTNATLTVENTLGFSVSGEMRWNTPANWAQNTVEGQTLYWVRIRRTTNPSTTVIASRIYLLQLLDIVSNLSQDGPYITVPLANTVKQTEILEQILCEAQRGASGSGDGATTVSNASMTVTIGKR